MNVINYTTTLHMDNQVIITTHGSSSSSNDDSNKKKKIYKGVRFRKWGKWVCEIRLPNSRERIWLGSYDSAEKAARAFDAALFCLRGPNATFNFPDTPFNLDINVPSNNSLTPQQIREIAANFANKNLPPIVIDNNNNNHNNNVNINNNGNGNGNGNGNVDDQSNIVKEISGSSSSTMHDNDNGNMIDWTFLNMLDGSSDHVGTDNYGGFYSDLEKMHSDELLYSIPPPFFEDYNHQDEMVIDDANDDPFSYPSFLWNWNF